MMLKAEVVVKAQFYDLDPMEVVWHGNYTKYLEQARCALLDIIGYDYRAMRDSGYVWPIVDIRIKYLRPICFRQELRVVATLLEYEYRLRIKYLIHDAITDEVITKAETIQVAVARESGEMCFESPPVLIEKLKGML